MTRYRVSVDIGGTFTDIVVYDVVTGEYKEDKVLSTPKNLSDAVVKGLDKKIRNYSEIDFFVHGTTAGLNAFLERKGAKVALITTKGFKDVYEIARGNRSEMYNLAFRKPKPLLERIDVFEVEERVLANGAIKQPLLKDSVIRVMDQNQKKRIYIYSSLFNQCI